MKTNFITRMTAFLLAAALSICLLPAADTQAADKPGIKSVIVKCNGKNITKKTLTLTEGSKTSLTVTVKPANAKKAILFKSSKPSIASISKKGVISAKKAGNSKITITATGKNGKKKSTYVNVKVESLPTNTTPVENVPTDTTPEETTPVEVIPVESVNALISKSELLVDETAQIVASVTPIRATDRNLTYSSSNETVAAVNQTGAVTARAVGTAVITVKASNNKSAEIAVTVKNKTIEAEKVIAKISPSAALTVGSSATITATVEPADAQNTGFTYSSSNNVVSVDQSGNVVGVKTGSSRIKVTASNGISTQITVTVSAAPEKNEIVEKELTISYTSTDDVQKSIYGTLYTPNQSGKHPVVILSHGFNGVGKDFEADCRYFAENGYAAYAYDFCGGSNNSRSSGNTTEMSIFTEKEDLRAVYNYITSLDNIDSEQVFLLGASMGGLVTALTAADMPDKIKGVVLYYPALNVPDDWRRNIPDEADIQDTQDVWGMLLGKQFFTSIRTFDPFEHIGNYKKNVLIIYGMKDTIVPFSYMTKAQETYDNEQLILYSNEGHGFWEKAQETREQVLHFIQNQ